MKKNIMIQSILLILFLAIGIFFLYKKDKNIKAISGDNRVTPDILYFHE